MESFLQDMTGSLLWTAVFSICIVVAGAVVVRVLASRATALKPVAFSLYLLVVFIALQAFLHFGMEERHPRLARNLLFFNWILFTFAVIRISLHVYGDLFVVRLRKGSFPAAFKNTITVVVIAVMTLFLLKEILNINIASLIAATTVLTATIGLAFQSTLANMLAGLTIHLEKPLKQGDWISAGGHEGRVLDITLRSTRIQTIEHNEVFIPNSKVLSEAVVNFSLPERVTVRKLSVGVNYHVPPNTVKSAVQEVLAGVRGVRKSPAPLVRVKEYGDFAVHYEIRYAIDDYSRHVDIEAEIMSLLWYRFRRNGIEIPYPIRNVKLHQVTAETLREEDVQRKNELARLIKAVEIFSPLTDQEITQLVGSVKIEMFASGEVPVHQGEAGDSFYIIRSGRVDVVVAIVLGDEAVVATLGPGNFFGEMSLLTGAARTSSIRVKEDAEFVVIDKKSFSGVLAQNPSIAESLSHLLAERQAGLDAGKERLDAATLASRRRDASGKMLSRIRDFFGLKK